MAIGNKQIGWSQEENLLWEISKQLDNMDSIMCTGPCPTSSTSSTTTTSTTTICNCREVVSVIEPYDFYDCTGARFICPGPGGCRDAPECMDISLPYNNVVPSETITLTCNCAPLINATSTFVQCGEVNVCPASSCSQPFSYYDVWITQECIDSWPSIGCAVWLDAEGTTPFPEGVYNNGEGGCIQITNGVVVAIP